MALCHRWLRRPLSSRWPYRSHHLQGELKIIDEPTACCRMNPHHALQPQGLTLLVLFVYVLYHRLASSEQPTDMKRLCGESIGALERLLAYMSKEDVTHADVEGGCKEIWTRSMEQHTWTQGNGFWFDLARFLIKRRDAAQILSGLRIHQGLNSP